MKALQPRHALLAIALPTLLTLSACDLETTKFMVGTLERDRIELKVESNEPIVEIHVSVPLNDLPGNDSTVSSTRCPLRTWASCDSGR